ncbi:MAG: VanZ family protein [Lysobacter sp.]|nr:VanZ family protein [Lysobacter sp.]
MNPRTLTALARIGLLVAVALVSHLAFTDRPYAVVSSLPDKFSHFAAFGVLALLADYAFPAAGFGAAKVFALAGYGLFIEGVQHFLPWREASFLDIVADGAGIAAYALCIPLLARIPGLRRPQKSPIDRRDNGAPPP